MNKQPWMKWVPQKWRAEPSLKLCSRPARSLWIDLLGLMHDANPYGHLLIEGVRPEPADIARILGDTEAEVMAWLAELAKWNVYSVTADGVIYSRRMVRDHAKAEADKANGASGGNPRLKPRDNEGVNPPDNRRVKRGDKPRDKARGENRESGKPLKGLPDSTRASADAVAAPPLGASGHAGRSAVDEPREQNIYDWDQNHPRWQAFRAKIGESEWWKWFRGGRLNGSETVYRADGIDAALYIRRTYGDALAEHFGQGVIVYHPSEKPRPD